MRTVLLVLQSEDFRFAMREVLQENYHVIAAPDVVSGAELLQESPDILILDLFLSGTDGLRFLTENRCLLPETVLLFTTLADPQVLSTALDLGVTAVFAKPYSLSAIPKWLESQA